MNYNDLNLIIKHFDDVVKGVAFHDIPQRDSEEYRQLVLKTSDFIFSDGRYSAISEWTLELFDVPETQEAIHNLAQINALSEDKRTRLRFYLDVKDVCYPLFRAQQVDWTAWPWNMSQSRNSIDNDDLFAFVTSGDYVFLSMAVCWDLLQLVWADEELYSSVAKNELEASFDYGIKNHWHTAKDEDEHIQQVTLLQKFASTMLDTENHMLVGRMLGFDHLTQSVYDAANSYIDEGYRYRQVGYALDMSAWLREHWTIGEPHPSQERVDELYRVYTSMLDKHGVSVPDPNYCWNILVLDVLGMSMFDESDFEDEDSWED